ncbi:DUF6153 family protein [Streptomyces sp. ISL-36]|uniref:DUF6153 family protein n=1 Tax=Streptomyces sp. ISL-36 TaxID=2819182 RepID=UPI002034ABE9|nr:DUF6153 family protein [Streptomyces sp. ISL-36]
MIRAAQLTRSRPAGHGFVVLVLVVLAGVLGMHALTPSPVPASHAGSGHAAAAPEVVVHHPVVASSVGLECSHTASGSGHLDHADATCAAVGVASAYVPPPLLGSATAAALEAAGVALVEGVEGRAPPDLSELQLLRI